MATATTSILRVDALDNDEEKVESSQKIESKEDDENEAANADRPSTSDSITDRRPTTSRPSTSDSITDQRPTTSEKKKRKKKKTKSNRKNSKSSSRTKVAPPYEGTYTGETVDGLREGKGVIEWNNGDTFDGMFSAGYRAGFGKYTIERHARVYLGMWRRSLRHGKGKETFAK